MQRVQQTLYTLLSPPSDLMKRNFLSFPSSIASGAFVCGTAVITCSIHHCFECNLTLGE